MNQNILIGLERQAEKLVLQIPAALDSNEYTSLFNEKFAELIVRECIDIISPYAIRMENFDGGHPIADLKKHFGVEE